MTDAGSNAKDIALLLPFYANGTLDAADTARVETALENDASLREELADVKSVSAMVTDGGAQWEAARKPADEARLDQLMDRIAAEPKAQVVQQAAPKETQPVIKIQRETPGFFASLFQPAWKPAFAAMALVAVAQGTMLYTGAGPANNRDNDEFITASGPDGTNAAMGYQLLLRIAPAATWRQVEAALAEHELSIVDGPTQDGVITVGTMVELSSAEKQQIAAALKASPAISAVLQAR
ncbi:MAG: hypothetical protein V3V15_12235 [Sphingorhabdus sp.]